jgi:hypothetical protein
MYRPMITVLHVVVLVRFSVREEALDLVNCVPFHPSQEHIVLTSLALLEERNTIKTKGFLSLKRQKQLIALGWYLWYGRKKGTGATMFLLLKTSS